VKCATQTIEEGSTLKCYGSTISDQMPILVNYGNGESENITTTSRIIILYD
jgi:hypothetical protein